MLRGSQTLIITDHALLRDAIGVALARSTLDAPRSTHAQNLHEAMACLDQSHFDLILLDLTVSDSDGFEGLIKLKTHNAKQTPVIVISTRESSVNCNTAKQLGAAGYLCNRSSFDTIKAAIDKVAQGDIVFPRHNNNHALPPSTANRACLTPAQKRVMTSLSDGLLNKQIAHEMGITEATVKAHMTAIFRKLGASNRTQAMLIYREATRANIYDA